MKPQDIAFIALFIIVLYLKKPRLAVWMGIICLALSMPLFAFWVFFTAERLTWYAAAFFLLSIALILFRHKK